MYCLCICAKKNPSLSLCHNQTSSKPKDNKDNSKSCVVEHFAHLCKKKNIKMYLEKLNMLYIFSLHIWQHSWSIYFCISMSFCPPSYWGREAQGMLAHVVHIRNRHCTFMSKDDFGPLSNSQVLFLLSQNENLLTLSPLQEWLDTRNVIVVTHILHIAVCEAWTSIVKLTFVFFHMFSFHLTFYWIHLYEWLAS